jgi:ribosomal-protein-alanine N-acetyltransferase
MSAVRHPALQFIPMRVGDLDEVTEIEAFIYEFPWTLGNFRDSLNAGYSCWVCRVDQTLAAYAVAMFAADEAHLLNLSVSAPWQGGGIGRTLLQFVQELACERHCDRLLLEVRPSNTIARHLYETAGFREVGRRKNYYPAHDGREDALVLECRL